MMDIEKDMVTSTEDAVMEEKNAVTLAKKENTKESIKEKRRKAKEAVKLAVSQCIGELLEKEGSLSKIAQKLYDVEMKIQANDLAGTNTANKDPSFEKSLGNWLRKENEPRLYPLCLLAQAYHLSYDYILGLDKTISTNQLTYGYTLAFFSVFSGLEK